MKTYTWILASLMLASTGGACVRPPGPADRRYPVTALLNNTAWFANAQAVKTRPENNDSCTANTLSLFIRTDIPYSAATIGTATTGCLTECTPTQRITFYAIPAKRGKYKLVKLDPCGVFDNGSAPYSLMLMGVGSGLFKSYHPGKKRPNWVQITKYDEAAGLVEGRFEMNLSGRLQVNLPDSSAPTARFHRGFFRASLKK